MDTEALTRFSNQIQTLMSAATTKQVQSAVQELVAEQQWPLVSMVLLTCSEVAARRIVGLLVENSVYEPLAWGASLRRQLRAPIITGSGAGIAGRIFRDVDTEEDTAGVPEHILADAQELTSAANERRQVATRREAQLDRGPIRSYIVEQLSQHLTEPEAREVLLIIAKASAWEETRREAALKLINHQPSIQQLASAGRHADLVAIANATGLQTVAANIASLLGEKLTELRATGDQDALSFIAENHPDASTKQAARQALS